MPIPEIEIPVPFEEYEVEGVGTVIDPQGESGYRVRTEDGRVIGFAARSGNPCEANAADDIANQPAPAPVVPIEVSPWQIRRALNAAGLRASVEAAVAGASQDTRDGWEFASTVRRDNAMLSGMAAAMGMTSAQLDQLFISAASFR